MRFCFQKDRSSCGPVAVLNALKWEYEGNFPEKEFLPGIKYDCRCIDSRYTRGVHPYALDTLSIGTIGTHNDWYYKKVLKLYFNAQKKRKSSVTTLDKHLTNGGSAILNFTWKEYNHEQGHYVFIPRKAGKSYYVTNYRGGRAVSLLNRETIKMRLRHSRVYLIKGWSTGLIWDKKLYRKRKHEKLLVRQN